MRAMGVVCCCALLVWPSTGCLQRELAELNPCLTSGENESVGGTGIDRVDLLFVVDNSLSMLLEQAKLRAQFPKLIRTLTSGVRQDGTPFTPVTDLHLAVITVDHLRALRPQRPDLVLFAAITGVPTRLIDAGGNVDLEDDSARNAYYDGILADADMQETAVDTAKDADTEPDSIRPACEAKNDGGAAPGRRIVQMAKAMGTQATLQSICAESFEPAMDAIIALISKRLGGVCLSKPLVRNHGGEVACKVVWDVCGRARATRNARRPGCAMTGRARATPQPARCETRPMCPDRTAQPSA